MSQRNIKSYFIQDTSEKEVSESYSSDSDEDLHVGNYILASGDVSYYNDLLKRKSELKKVAKVVCESGLSECWNFFGDLTIAGRKVLEKHTFCKVCFEAEGMVLKSFGKTTSTTNLINHLRSVHDIDIKSVNYKKNTLMTQKALDPKSNKANKFQNGRRLAEMCCIDLQPFAIVEREGFQKYLNYLDPKIDLPTAYTVSTSGLNDVYDLYNSHVKNILKSAPQYMCLVLDMWSDKYKRLSYINIKVHYCQNFELKVVTLKTEIFQRPHTGQAVSEKIRSSVSEFNLESKDLCAVTDGGTNIVLALKMENITRYGCSAHALHRFLSHDILNNENFKHIHVIVGKLKNIYRSLMYSSAEISRLQKLKEQDELTKILLETQQIIESVDSNERFPSGDDNFNDELENALHSSHSTSLKNSVPTRWNSLLVMLNSFNKNIDIINIALLRVKKDPLIIPDMEKMIIKEFANFLQIFEKATQYLQAQQYPTISAYIYFYEKIMISLEKVEEESSFDLTIKLCNFSKENFGKRFKILKIHLVAAILDPCQKNWPVLDKYLKKISKFGDVPSTYHLVYDTEFYISKEQLIINEIKKLKNVNDEGPSTSSAVLLSSKRQKISDTRQEMLEFVSNPSLNMEKDPLSIEVKKYLAIQVDEMESIDWWQQHKEIFPNVAKLADVCFGIPATSASSEQAFSVAGSCVNEKRSNLNTSTIKKQLFIHDNNKVVQPYLTLK